MKACWCYTFVWNVATIWFPHWFTPGSLDNHNTVLVNLTSALYCDLLSCLARTRHYDQIWSRLFESSARIFLFWHCLWMPPIISKPRYRRLTWLWQVSMHEMVICSDAPKTSLISMPVDWLLVYYMMLGLKFPGTIQCNSIPCPNIFEQIVIIYLPHYVLN